MQFQVPQFIETEDRVVGPLTFKQFLYIGIAGFITAMLFLVLEPVYWAVAAFFLLGSSAGLAFLKINGRPIGVFVKAYIRGVWSPRVYVFGPAIPKASPAVRRRKPRGTEKERVPRTPAPPRIQVPAFEGIKGLREWLATSKTAIPRREKPLPKNFGAPPEETLGDQYEVVRHLTGEREVAKRIDYR